MYKLLLADDSITIQRVIELTFSGQDVEVLAVSDGEQAIARIPIEHPDIVLADIGMPKRSGYDVAAFVKTHPELSHIPVLLLAGAFEPVDEVRAQQVRCDGVLVKPFEPQQVIARVRELVAGGIGSPSSGIGAVPRPVERLSPSRPFEPAHSVALQARAAETVPPQVAPMAPQPVAAPPAMATKIAEALDLPAPEAAGPEPLAAPTRSVEPVAQPEVTLPSPEPMQWEPVDLDAAAPAPEPPVAPEPAPPTQLDRPLGGEVALGRSREDRASVILPDDSLEDYFDRLDAAFATLGKVHTPHGNGASPVQPEEPPADIPTLDHVLGSGARESRPSPDLPEFSTTPVAPPLYRVASPPPEPADSNRTLAAAPAPLPPPASTAQDNGGRSLLAQAFNALLAVEQGEPGAGPVRLTRETPPPMVTDAMVEEVTRRVLLQLSPEAVKAVVGDIVAEVAERLVREEIHRVRSGG